MQYNKTNNLVGWAVFLIATAVYLLTMEATGNLWDCGEFASCAYKIQNPHPPGAPLFVLIGRLFMIPFGPEKAAVGLNAMSALASSFTILFLFWTITHFAKKIIAPNDTDLSFAKTLNIMAAGAVGALAYTFSDSFWFSAVEGEVYALSSFFTALVFWAAVKWEQAVDKERAAGITDRFTGADRWLIFIFYLMGLSIGVHLLNLLTIPAIVIIYYFKRYQFSLQGFLIAFVLGCVITGVVQKAVVQWSIKGAGNMDILFVNDLGLPFFSGFAFFFCLIAGVIFMALRIANSQNWNFLRLGTWSFTFMLIGFFSYITTMIRSNADVSIDMNNVDNPATLVSYLGREQYGDWPIVVGNYFNEEPPSVEGSKMWTKGKNQYNEQGNTGGYDYAGAENTTIFPRMYDFRNERNSHYLYRQFGGLEDGEDPEFKHNLRYFMGYQMGVMYMRYFLWNFAGKQNDLQGFGNIRDGNFISGVSFIDNALYGDQSKLPDSISKNNKAENKLYFLPLILGILGIIFQFAKNKKDFTITTLLFFFTGIAIVIYLNQAGMQPRERDYAYVGSFYAFAIWIGLGVLFVSELFQKIIQNEWTAALTAGAICTLAVPVLMASEEWDDHDRSKKTIARDLAIDYLESCAPNAILFSFGDNDTYPLWYAQEVEGIRKDVRVINYALLSSDWYFNQLRYKLNDSNPMDMIFTEEQVDGNKRSAIAIMQRPGYDANTYYDLYEVLKKYTASDDMSFLDPQTNLNVIPTKKVSIPVDSMAIMKDSTYQKSLPIMSRLNLDLKPNYIYKNSLAILSMLATNNWKRPIYFTSSSDELDELGLDKYLEIEGMCKRLVPYRTSGINKERTVSLLLNTFKFGNASTPGVYFDEVNRGHLLMIRQTYALTAKYLCDEAANMASNASITGRDYKADSARNFQLARQLIQAIDKGISDKNMSYGMASGRGADHNNISKVLMDVAFQCGEKEIGNRIKTQLEKDLKQQHAYYLSLGDPMSNDELSGNLYACLNGLDNNLTKHQQGFARDWISCLQLMEQMKTNK